MFKWQREKTFSQKTIHLFRLWRKRSRTLIGFRRNSKDVRTSRDGWVKRIDGRQKEINSASRNLSVLGGGQFTLAISGSDFDVQCDLRSKDRKTFYAMQWARDSNPWSWNCLTVATYLCAHSPPGQCDQMLDEKVAQFPSIYVQNVASANFQ